MARQIVVERGGATSAFDFKKVDRAQLYGKRRRVPLDPDGGECARAELTADSGLLVRSGMTAQGYFDASGYWYAQGDLVALDPEGQEAPTHPSTLGEAQPLEAVGAEALLDLRVQSVYALDPAEVDEGLAAALAAGEVFAFDFVYRAGPKKDRGLLVANDTGVYALIGQPTTPEWCELAVVAQDDWSAADDGDDFDDDLDFEMF
ncbi:MAG: hypothetical protein KC613_03780 [Myxococcales bacterium]|nr:hypothetical protein [Myxococcales bacterium]MCB9524901.1 hypothetical protein [Myxococcales bacterium]